MESCRVPHLKSLALTLSIAAIAPVAISQEVPQQEKVYLEADILIDDKENEQMIAEGILSGRFRPGEKLPSTRKLARHLGVSRITVTLAYNELQANDYLTSAGRSGYYISQNAPQPPHLKPTPKSQSSVDWSRALSARIPVTSLAKPSDWRSYRYPFVYGQADPALFDQKSWRLCALQSLGSREFDSLTADHADRDDPLLVEFILRHILPNLAGVVIVYASLLVPEMILAESFISFLGLGIFGG